MQDGVERRRRQLTSAATTSTGYFTATSRDGCRCRCGHHVGNRVHVHHVVTIVDTATAAGARTGVSLGGVIVQLDAGIGGRWDCGQEADSQPRGRAGQLLAVIRLDGGLAHEARLATRDGLAGATWKKSNELMDQTDFSNVDTYLHDVDVDADAVRRS